MPHFVTVVGFFYLRQRRGSFDNRGNRLAGGASNSEMAPIDKSSSPEPVLKREAGGGCPPPSTCTHSSTRCDYPDADCSATASSCCSSRCGCYQVATHQSPPNCQPCSSPLPKPILKKRNCCQCITSDCMCQPMPRSCNCPPPVQVDARAIRECSCDCPSSPECACPPSERRFRRTTTNCPNAHPCCPFPGPSADPKCQCARCQPCLPPSCNLCPSGKCRGATPLRNPCRPSSPHPSCAPFRTSTACRKLTFCAQPSSRSSCKGTGQSLVDNGNWDNDVCSEGDDVEELDQHDIEDCDSVYVCLCALDCAEPRNVPAKIDKSCDPLPNEGLVKDSKNSSKTANPSRSVDPDLHGVLGGKGKSVHENTAGALAEYISENPVKDSRHTSSVHASSYDRAKPDRYTFRGGYSPGDKKLPENSVLARLSNRAKSPALAKRQQDLSAPHKLSLRQAVALRDAPHAGLLVDVLPSISATPARGIDRQRAGGSSEKDTFQKYILGKSCNVWNVWKLSPSMIADCLTSALFRLNKNVTSLLSRK